MLIVDAQIHVWGRNTPERPWPTSTKGRAHSHGDELTWQTVLAAMDQAGVDRAVLVPPTWEGDRNDLALEAARLHPRRFAVMGRIAPELPGAPALLDGWLSQPGMLGVRMVFQPGQPWLTDNSADWLWPRLEQLGIPMMAAPQGHFDMLEDIARAYPKLRIVIDHMGCRSPRKDEEAFADLDRVLAFARHPNVAVKASAMPCYSTAPYPFANVHGYIRRAFDAFGPQRFFWGTDLSRLTCSYREAVTMFTEALPWLKGEDLERAMGRGVCEWIGWKPD